MKYVILMILSLFFYAAFSFVMEWYYNYAQSGYKVYCTAMYKVKVLINGITGFKMQRQKAVLYWLK